LRQSSASSSKNKPTASSHTLSYKHFSRTSSHSTPRSKIAKQCRQTPTSPTVSQPTEGRHRTKAAAATPVASSAAVRADTILPQRPRRRRETARRPHPIPMAQSTSRKTERPPVAPSQARAVRTPLRSTSTLYFEPSQQLSKPSADQAAQQLRGRKT